MLLAVFIGTRGLDSRWMMSGYDTLAGVWTVAGARGGMTYSRDTDLFESLKHPVKGLGNA